ncbi:adp-heptose--lipooligosaccharide heptosyltransferase ii [hydrocarbon metagenome]|uniref:Adp-heptose--lipooligosaccharide heptosyltransferase ii n=1 Tax=hydrocarbon metagenome TaxID=938273 RepID=A0A0W8G0C3_9ZZZZ
MKILVIQTAFPGDAILTLPLIQEIKNFFSSAQIDVVCIPSTSIIFKASHYVSEVIEFDKRNKHKGFSGLIKFASYIKSKKYDKIYSPHRSARSAVLTFLSKPKESYSFDKSALSFLYKNKNKYKSDWHEVRRNLSLLDENYTDESWKILPQLSLSAETTEFVDKKIKGVDQKKMIVLAPGSVWATKRYPINYFKVISEELIKNGYQIVIIGGKEDKQLTDEISVGNKEIINLCGELNFIESIYLLTKSILLISNDSAPTHLAMCADIPVLTIYCSTVPKFGFYPYNKSSRVISYDKLDCKPCGIHGFQKCPEKHFNCGLYLKPEKVLEEVNTILMQRYSLHN